MAARKRNYKREYSIYHAKPDQKKRRAARNTARRRLIKAGVKVIIQSGGSIRDKESILAANKAKAKMIFTGIRHFNH